MSVVDSIAERQGGRVIFVDDDRDLLAAQTQGLEIAGFTVQPFSRAADALRHMTTDFDGVVVSDVRMPDMDGLTLFGRIHAIDADIPVILITGHGDVPMAVQALKQGAYDFLAKPFPMEDLTAALRRAGHQRRLVLENRELRRLHAQTLGARGPLIGDSPAMVQLHQILAQVADAEIDVLITGPTGAGKESAARALHQMSRRRSRPFVQINCASLPEETFHAELFGLEPGAKFGPYGGSARRSVGRLEKADRGTLLLDEVEGLSLAQQAKLLDVVEARELWPVGASEPRPLDLRIVATSRADLRAAVDRGEFRADLFYRLSGLTLQVPPLSERKGDVRLLFQHFLLAACSRQHRPVPTLSSALLAHLQSHDWPGNVRELEHFAGRVALGVENTFAGGEGDGAGLHARVSQFEADVIREALTACQGDAQSAMARLALPRKTFYDKLARHGLKIADYRRR